MLCAVPKFQVIGPEMARLGCECPEPGYCYTIEHGIVYLRGKSLAERARLLISIAHPDDREELEKAACKRFGYSFLRLKP